MEMISFVAQHPFYTIGIGWFVFLVAFVCLFTWGGPFWKSGKFTTGGIVGGNPDKMRNRFTADDGEPVMRSLLMADQIVHDQQIAHEEPGPETTAPAPGERHYEDPCQIVHIVVGAYTVHLVRDNAPVVTEALLDPNVNRTRDVRPEDADLISTLAMEVLRLREGWTVA
jgi:hypothetical protein